MENLNFHDGNINGLIESRTIDARSGINSSLQMHSSLIRRLSMERELEGHQGCVNAVAWNSKGSLLISGSDDTHVNIWNYADRKLLHSIDTGHTANIFCTKFVPETSDELVVSGAGDAEVRLFNLSRSRGRELEESAIAPLALFQCHTKRVKKLAVEVGNPNMVWSASEDGTLRQHDLREVTSCPPAGSSHQECRNVLLDLRCGAKKSLADPPRQSLALKSFDISSTRPHLLLVGGSDAFARLYDRRMLPPLSSCRTKLSPPPCVNYFCPVHLSTIGRSPLHLTHVTFSPDGQEALLSYSGEHVYLMDVNPAHGSTVRYTPEDASKLYSLSPALNRLEVKAAVADLYPNGFSGHRNFPVQLNKCRKLLQAAEKSLNDAANYYYGVEACNDVLDGHGHVIGPTLMHECLCTRAALFLKRKWKNDAHMAVRDCQRALKIDACSFRALLCMAKALSELSKHKEALDFAVAAQTLAPTDSDSEVAVLLESIKKQNASAEAKKRNKANDRVIVSEPGAGGILSWTCQSDASSDASQPRSDRGESDYDEELEVDFETSASGDEGHDVELAGHLRSVNVRIRRRGDSAVCTGNTNVSCDSPMLSPQSDRSPYQHEGAIDMKHRYVGHCNVGTDIKQASFLGQKGEFIASGSDDGRWFIWEKKTSRLIKVLIGDDAVVNCVQCHPFDCVVATSGIDSTIKIWTPLDSAASVMVGRTTPVETPIITDVMEINQQRLSHNCESLLPFDILEGFRMHEFPEGSLRPFECTQS